MATFTSNTHPELSAVELAAQSVAKPELFFNQLFSADCWHGTPTALEIASIVRDVLLASASPEQSDTQTALATYVMSNCEEAGEVGRFIAANPGKLNKVRAAVWTYLTTHQERAQALLGEEQLSSLKRLMLYPTTDTLQSLAGDANTLAFNQELRTQLSDSGFGKSDAMSGLMVQMMQKGKVGSVLQPGDAQRSYHVVDAAGADAKLVDSVEHVVCPGGCENCGPYSPAYVTGLKSHFETSLAAAFSFLGVSAPRSSTGATPGAGKGLDRDSAYNRPVTVVGDYNRLR